MMGDKFQLGPFNDVIVGGRQRVTPGTKFFLELFSSAQKPVHFRSMTMFYEAGIRAVGVLVIGSCARWEW